MVKSRRVFTREFKLAAVKELGSGKPVQIGSGQRTRIGQAARLCGAAVGSQSQHAASLAPRIQSTTYESVLGSGPTPVG